MAERGRDAVYARRPGLCVDYLDYLYRLVRVPVLAVLYMAHLLRARLLGLAGDIHPVLPLDPGAAHGCGWTARRAAVLGRRGVGLRGGGDGREHDGAVGGHVGGSAVAVDVGHADGGDC